MKCLFEFMFYGFWHFVGGFLVLWMLIMAPLSFIIKLVNRILRHRNIRLHGYPPAHCDADGDFKQQS